MCLAASAQSWQEALMFSQQDYAGTARSMAMGNALTAIGGDTGSLMVNPAGSAVAGYTQITVTPAVIISASNATGNFSGNYLDGETSPIGFGDAVKTNYAAFNLPNVAFLVKMNTGRRSGLRRMSFGVALNATQLYAGRFNASGLNSSTSYAASLASSAEGFTANDLASDWYSGQAEWVDRVAYLSGMFNGIPNWGGYYQALTETRSEEGGELHRWVPAPLKQMYGEQTAGMKDDLVFNFAMDFSDKFYLGFNLGLTAINYGMSEYWYEEPNNPDEFAPIIYDDNTQATFQSLRMKRNYRLRGTGVFAKVGMLWRPVAGLRLGAAIQTPTLVSMNATNAFYGEVSLRGKTINPYSSPTDQWSYKLVNPFRFNLGAAYTFGSVGVLSADYEMVNYRQAKYNTGSGDYGGMPAYMSDANLDIQDALGVSHLLRVGAEVRPTEDLSIRAGFNYTTTGQQNFLDYQVDNSGKVQVIKTPLTPAQRAAQASKSASLGVGYTLGAFFIDAAVRARFLPKEYVTPYYYYTYDGDYTDKFRDADIAVPEIEVKSTRFDVLLTLGWRF